MNYEHALIVVLIIIIILFWFGSEHMQNQYIMNQLSSRYSDPMEIIYLGDERDVSGMSKRDYYLENQLNHGNEVLKNVHGDSKFKDHTGYMDMPIQYRPWKTNSPVKAQIHANNFEEYVYQDINMV